jgi:hypothetical protein
MQLDHRKVGLKQTRWTAMRAWLGLLFLTAPAWADERSQAYDASALQIIIAFHCDSVPGFLGSYEIAVAAARNRLAEAGFNSSESDTTLQRITGALTPDTSTPAPPELCHGILSDPGMPTAG